MAHQKKCQMELVLATHLSFYTCMTLPKGGERTGDMGTSQKATTTTTITMSDTSQGDPTTGSSTNDTLTLLKNFRHRWHFFCIFTIFNIFEIISQFWTGADQGLLKMKKWWHCPMWRRESSRILRWIEISVKQSPYMIWYITSDHWWGSKYQRKTLPSS